MLAGGNSLANYYMTIFALCQHHGWSVTEIEDMMPFERDIYVAMLVDYIEKEKERLQNQGYQDA